ncbi:hypothetical protein [uncultured Acinetobacter sp.]|uniref:hypothetical protein n=1 Tax=uncultured Acinetobacter sp. TaxID=165433 RepID=UPI0037492C52
MYQPFVIHQELALTGASFLKRLQQLEDTLIQILPDDAKIEPPINHHFSPGLYIREMRLNAGDMIIGKTHRYAHFCRVVRGRALVYSEHGWAQIEAPFYFQAPAGIKRLFIALDDFVFQTEHETHLTDLDAIEKHCIVPNEHVHQFRLESGMEVYS